MAVVSNNLKILPLNKTVVFYSPIEGDDILVRTGILEDKCNFLHSVLYSYSSDYVNMEEKDRKKFVKRLRASMAGIIDKNNWSKNALLSHNLFCNNLCSSLDDIYLYLETNNIEIISSEISKNVISEIIPNKDKFKLYELIVKLLPSKQILDEILPNIIENTRELSIKSLTRIILDNIVDLFNSHPTIVKTNKDKTKYLLKKIKNLYNKLFKEVENYSFNKYIKELEKQSEIVDDFCMEFATEKFDRNIYIIDNNRLPNINFEKYNIYNRKCIVILKLDENHYEIIGRLLNDNYVQREFDFDDILIKNIKSYFNTKKNKK